MNPFPADRMKPAERRAALCTLLALGLTRLHTRNAGRVHEEDGEFPLHNQVDQSGHATTEKEAT